MIVATTRRIKPRIATTRTSVLFDATRHRNRFSPAFAAGLTPATRWTGDHRYAPWTQEEADWASEVFLAASAAELEAEEDAYHAMLEQLAFEDAAVSRLARGHCL